MPNLIDSRQIYSQERLNILRNAIAGVPALTGLGELCVYVTGSYGRLEASEHSDLDLFFVHTGSSNSNQVSNISETLVRADLIRKCRELGFPEFSGDAKYLEIHYLNDMKQDMGSPIDDYKNFFTARLLLLLESRPVFNDAVYKKVVRAIIDAYYRDYHDHQSDFRPIFLANDIVRFWKTLCLNYEHRRNRPPRDEAKRNENHLKNLKLKFSRMLTCFSTVISLSDTRRTLGPADLIQLIYMTPLDRLREVARQNEEGGRLLNGIQEEYEWFLEATGRPPGETLAWIAEKSQRDLAFGRARTFGKHMYDLLVLVSAGSDALRYLVI